MEEHVPSFIGGTIQVMGYCHYWSRPSELEATAFGRFVGEVRETIGLVKPRFLFFGGIKIGGSLGFGSPILTDQHVCFNGRPSMETFWVPRVFADKNGDRKPDDGAWHSDFVKTSQLPYDAVVTAALCAFKRSFPNGVDVSSDGGREEWQAGLKLYSTISGNSVDELWDMVRRASAR